MAGSKSQHELMIEIAGKIASSFGGAIGNVNKQMATVGKVATKAAKLTAQGMMIGGAAIVGVAAASANVGTVFESQMSTVAAISGAVGDEFVALEEKAKEMGATTQFSATEAGQAMEYMAMAGWKSSDMVDGIAGIMNLAAASGEDLASTSDIVTDALTAFGMTASESGRFADVLAAASSNANTNVSMLGESFKYVAPLAGTLGYTAKDTSIALGLMANAGIKGSQAGTSLKTAIANMSAPTAKQAAAMQKLGISLLDSEGGMKDLREVMMDMRTRFAGLSESEQTAAASMIFGKEAMSGMLAIINASETDFGKLTAAIDDSAGAAERMAAVRLDNLEGDITLLKSGLEGLGIEIYQGMNAPMREAAQKASKYIAQMNEAFQKGGFSGMAEEIGNIASDAMLNIADNAPEFIEVAAVLIDNFVEGIEKNSSEIGASIGRLITICGSAIIRLSPRLVVAGAHLLVEIAKGIISNLPELKSAASEAISYLMNAAKEAFADYANFLGNDEVKPFEKFIALLPAVAAGFAVFGGISGVTKKISGFIGNIKKAGKSVSGFTQTSNEMSAAAKNMAAVGAGIALAAAGFWLLADAAVRITQAGPEAGIALAAMAAGIGALMVIASKMGTELNSAKSGLIAFGTAVLMISAGMSLMAYAAGQLAAAGPSALAGLIIMEGGMIAMMVIADTFGKKLTNAAPGLLAFGAAILMAAAGMSLMAVTASQLGSAGTGAVVTLGLMVAGLAGFMAIVALMGPQMTAASVGLIAFGAGIALASAGIYVMAQAAIQLSAAGAPAQITMAILAVGLLAFGAAAGALAPLLLAGAAGLAAFGAALVIVSTAAVIGSAALLIVAKSLPVLSEYGMSGAVAILGLGTAMTVFSAGAALAGTGAAAAGLGFGTLAIAAAAADIAFAPLAVEMAAVAAAIAVIAGSAGAGADGIRSLKESSSGIVVEMGKLAVAFVPAIAAITPFAGVATVTAAAVVALSVSLAGTGAALLLVGSTATAAGAGFQIMTVALMVFRNAAIGMGASAAILMQALLLSAAGAVPAAAAFLRLVPSMAMAAAASVVLATGIAVITAAFAPLAIETAAVAASIAVIAAGAGAGADGINSLRESSVGMITAMGKLAVAFAPVGASISMLVVQWRASQQQITAIWLSYRTSFASAWSSVHSYAVNAAKDTAQQIKEAFEQMTITVPKPRLPHVSTSFSTQNMEGVQTRVPQFSVSYYADGAIMKDPTLFGMVGGEKGPEGIIPLDPFWNHLDSGIAAAVAGNIGGLSRVSQDAEALSGMGLQTDRTGSRAKEIYQEITAGGMAENVLNDNRTADSSKIVYSPQIIIQGNADKNEVQSAMTRSQEEFNRMMDEYNWQNGRTSMSR